MHLWETICASIRAFPPICRAVQGLIRAEIETVVVCGLSLGALFLDSHLRPFVIGSDTRLSTLADLYRGRGGPAYNDTHCMLVEIIYCITQHENTWPWSWHTSVLTVFILRPKQMESFRESPLPSGPQTGLLYLQLSRPIYTYRLDSKATECQPSVSYSYFSWKSVAWLQVPRVPNLTLSV